MQMQWSAQKLEYLRLLTTNILQSEKKTITGREALHLTDVVGQSGGEMLSVENAEGSINRLLAARWIKVWPSPV